MTAIAGLWRLDGRPDARVGCARMLSAQAMYGPDASGIWDNSDISLGRQLMRLLPEDVHDDQPLQSESGIVLVGDIRLDNREDLQSVLQVSADRARYLSDADIFLRCYERWATDCFERIVGDYAIAVWELRNRRLILARDPFGKRPLYYHRTPSLFAFSSMPKGLHALPEVPYKADETRMAEFVALMRDATAGSYFEAIDKIGSGCLAVVTASNMAISNHWRPIRRSLAFRRPIEYAEALRERLDEAVRVRLRGTGDVGTHLSGGYDSAAVAATAARLMTARGGRVHAFTAVPRDGYSGPVPTGRSANEGPLAASVAALYPNMTHTLVRTGVCSPLDGLDRQFFLYDEPVLNLCNMTWIDAINDSARNRRLTVMLAGVSGNVTISYAGLELFAELLRNRRYVEWIKQAFLFVRKTGNWKTIASHSLGPWSPAWLWNLAKRSVGHSPPDVLEYSMLHPQQLTTLNLRKTARQRHVDLAYRPFKDGAAARLSFLQRGNPGPLQKGMLAGWRVDLRDPTADRRLVEFCLSVPTEQFLRDGQPRALARLALQDRLPPAVLNAQASGYQAADWHEHLSGIRDALAAEVGKLEVYPPAARTLATGRMRSLLDNWPADGWNEPEVIQQYRFALLRGISAGHFLRRAGRTND
jgi:asparagine synthase (glutamine-hydrolysing)